MGLVEKIHVTRNTCHSRSLCLTVSLVWSWCPTYINRKRRNWETRQRQSEAHKRELKGAAKRKLMVQPEISHEAAEQILRNPATRTDDNFCGAIHVSHQLALLQGYANVFFCKQCGAVNAGGTLKLLKALCDGTGESRQKARRTIERGLMRRSAHFICCAFFLHVA